MDASGDITDFGARVFDANFPVFLSRDPYEKDFSDIAPYSALGNNPIFLIDPDGRKVVPSFTDPVNEEKYNAVITSLKSSSEMFAIVYGTLDEDFDRYRVAEFTSAELKKYPKVKGYFGDYIGCFLKSDIYPLAFNQSPGGVNGFENSTIFEEFFHAGQADFYGTFNSVRAETEAKVAKIFTAYKNASYKNNSDIVLGSLIEFGVSNYEIGFLFKDPTQMNSIVKEYFDKLIDGGEISEDLEASYRKEIIKFAKNFVGPLYELNAEEIDDYDGETDFMDSLIEETHED